MLNGLKINSDVKILLFLKIVVFQSYSPNIKDNSGRPHFKIKN